jgi:hypothetical protein
MMLLVALATLAFCVGVGITVALILWHPTGPPILAEDPPGRILPTVAADVVNDWCEGYVGEDGWIVTCLATPTHELVGEVTTETGQGSAAMVATFCEAHAPAGAVRVRWVEVASTGG